MEVTSWFSERRRQLLERLDHDGAVRQVPSWQRFVEDLRVAVGAAR